MNERDLIELAAKAVGIKVKWAYGWSHTEEGKEWNALTDDGAELRLAVRLGLCMDFRSNAAWVCNQDFPDSALGDWMGVSEWHHADAYAATRLAIVKAAAEIYKMAEETK